MEIFCSKRIGNSGVLEYKLVQGRQEHTEWGSMNIYGIRVKYCAPDDFQYYSADNVASKPQTLLQVIKYLFDKSVMPGDVFEHMEVFLKTP